MCRHRPAQPARCRGAHVGRRLGRGFFARDAATVARELIGATLVVDRGSADEVWARVVEAEAYRGADDPASHAFRGPTPRAGVMFGAPGHLYVYLSYGLHHCANLVCGPVGTGAAVLLRAASVERGEHVVRRRRDGQGRLRSPRLLGGPGNLCRGLGIDLGDNASDVCGRGRVELEEGVPAALVSTGPRVGISRATDLPLRFWDASDAAVSGRRTATEQPATARGRTGNHGQKEGTGISAGP